jgi:hypothetical protein
MATHSCQQCGKVFTGSEYLTKHISRRHPQVHGKENNVIQVTSATQATVDEDIDTTVDEGARRLAELVAKAKADEVNTVLCGAILLSCMFLKGSPGCAACYAN